MNKPRPEIPILDIQDLSVAYHQGGRWLAAVRDVSLSIRSGETYGLVGESGSGKSTIVLAVMRYLARNGRVQAGKIELAGRDLVALDETAMRQVWGKQATLVPQNPQSSLHPSLRIGEQIAETLRHHQGLSSAAASRRAVELLDMVRLVDPQRVADSYPHQISGGMQQRVMIAMALSTEPLLLILDEPTTSLDVTTQAVILDLVRELIRGRQTAALYVTHNLGVVATLCDRVGVLYAGELVEDAITADLFHQPLHPYTQGLLDSVPRMGETKARSRLRVIQGQIPPLEERAAGCIFAPRCPLPLTACAERPPLYEPRVGRRSRCHRWHEIEQAQVSARQPLPEGASGSPRAGDQSVLLSIDRVQTHFPVRRSLHEWLQRRPQRWVRALDNVTLTIPRGKTVGLVGESGSGKTTLARTIMGLAKRTGGSICFKSIPLPAELSQRDREALRHLQMVFQNPEEALNPYLTVGETLTRPLMILLKNSSAEANAQVSRLLKVVRLPASYAGRMPSQLSGGELQRVAIARAFASNPDLLVADEPVSSLDVSVQASILNLLNELQIEHGSSLLFISHNLAVVGYLADTIAVIYLGNLVQVADTDASFEPPYHPYTEALLSAVPLADPDAEPKRLRLKGEVPSPMKLPTGCPFHTRCPRALGRLCEQQIPSWQVDTETGKRIFCHTPLERLAADQVRLLPVESLGHG